MTTILHALRERAAATPAEPALWHDSGAGFSPISWSSYADQVQHAALGLEALGFRGGDCLALFGSNRPEWLFANLAATALGGAGAGIYTSSSDEQLTYVLRHSAAKIAVVEEGALLQRVLDVSPQLPDLETIVVIGTVFEATEPRLVSFEQLLAAGRAVDPARYSEALARLDPSALATLSYTSGTTGAPKGVMLNHHALLASTRAMCEVLGLGTREVFVSYLPLSHIAEQLSTIYGPIAYGSQVYFCSALERLPQTLLAAQPTAFFGVPGVWEKLRRVLEEQFARAGSFAGAVIRWARGVLRSVHRARLEGRSVGLLRALGYALAVRLLARKVRAKLGFTRTALVTTSAAPIAPETLEFYLSLGLVLHQLYGQSETVGATSANTRGDTRLHSHGRVMPKLELRFDDEGEILVRGGAFCMGYYKDAAATRALFDGDWLRTGDVGALDRDGYLHVAGRKNDVIALPNGEKIAPTPIEDRLRAIDPIEQAVVFGADDQLVALLTLDATRAATLARAQGWPEDSAELAAHGPFLTYLHDQVAQRVHALGTSDERLGEVHVRGEPLSIAAGELTPTLKPKRRLIRQRWLAQRGGRTAPSKRAEPAQALEGGTS